MYDKDLIERVCNLTCSKEDVCRNQTTINYDTEYPFKKYYDVNIIIGTLKKYISKEWDARTLAYWCCIYNWVLSGGLSKNRKEVLNLLEKYLLADLSWSLDGLSFCSDDANFENRESDIYEIIEDYKDWDYVWQTRDSWKGIYVPIGKFDKANGDQYVLLINENSREYMILFSEHLSNNYKNQNEYLKYTSKNKFVKLVEKVKDEYKIISCSEEFYYSDLYDLSE